MSPLAPTRPRLAYGFGGPAGAPALVFVNGLGGSKEAWYHQVVAFKRSHRVLCFDQRGTGGSEPGEGPVGCRDLARDLLGLLTLVGVYRAVIVGISFGGRVALELAFGWPGRVVGLALCGSTGGGPGAPVGDPPAHALLRRAGMLTAEEWREGVFPALFGQAYRERNAHRLERLARWWAAHPQPQEGIARQWQAWDAFDRWGDLPGLRCPTLVLHGDSDALCPPENGRRLAHRIPGARLVLLEGLGHSPNVEDPQAFNEALRGFLGEVGHR